MRRVLAALAFSAVLALAQTLASPSFAKPAALNGVGLDQKMGAQVPLDVPFTDEHGQPATLRQYLGKPVILALVYYSCPSLCNMILEGIARSVNGLSMDAGKEFEIVAVSFDPRELSSMAMTKKESLLKLYSHPEGEAGWHLLVGPEGASRTLANSVGFRFRFDEMSNQYVHPSAIMILTPEGKVARYFYGINYSSRDMRLGLVEASHGKIGTPVDQVLLYCYHYDPKAGKYGFVIMNTLRVGGLVTLGALLGFVFMMLRRDFHSGHSHGHVAARGEV